jgi:hypothetical protein
MGEAIFDVYTDQSLGKIKSVEAKPPIKADYQGWTNHATWAVALHIDNDQGYQSMVIEMFQRGAKDGMVDYELGDALKEFVEDFMIGEDINNSFVSDMVSGYMSGVNWGELVKDYKKQAAELPSVLEDEDE